MFGKEFREFCTSNRVDSFEDINGELYITQAGFELICRLVKVIDGRNGGLVLGKSHSDGGIHLLQKNANGTYRYVGEMEGNEYLSPPKLPTSIFKELEKINCNASEILEDIPKNIDIIDLRNERIQIINLSTTTQFIVNKVATMSNLNRIIEILNNY